MLAKFENDLRNFLLENYPVEPGRFKYSWTIWFNKENGSFCETVGNQPTWPIGCELVKNFPAISTPTFEPYYKSIIDNLDNPEKIAGNFNVEMDLILEMECPEIVEYIRDHRQDEVADYHTEKRIEAIEKIIAGVI